MFGHSISDNAELLKLADFFQIESMKKICENEFLSKLRPENALKYYKVAIESNAEHLKEKSKEVIGKWTDSIMSSQGWMDDLRELSDVELMLEMLVKKGTKPVALFGYQSTRYGNAEELDKKFVKSMKESFSSLYNDEET